MLAPRTVLDIGCAMGFLVDGFRHFGIEAFGIDMSKYAIKKSGESKHYLLLADASVLPFRDNCFDLVTMIEVIEHLPNYNSALGEIRRVLRQKGYLYVTTPSGRFHKSSGGHVSLKDEQSWVKIFLKHGFKPERSTIIGRIALKDWEGPRARKFMLHKLGLVGDLLRLLSGRLEHLFGYRHWLRFLLRVNSK
jgi:ubiquinone/menaquinone biosynthesis C-methylase UbiE